MKVEDKPVIVVGGGVAGLAAAAFVARAGRRVVLLERAQAPGGRATTHETRGFFLNLGPHALYATGAGRAVLDELNVGLSGNYPTTHGLHASYEGRRYLLPSAPGSLLRTRLLPWRDKLEILKLLAVLSRLDAGRFESMTVEEWLDATSSRERARAFTEALVRVTTYTNAPERLGAAPALRQLQLAVTGNVFYLDRGWQTLVDGLLAAARDEGAQIRTASPVRSVSSTGVTLEDGRDLDASAVVLAVPPNDVARLTGRRVSLDPVRAACLDVALSRLPDPGTNFVLGIDEPMYLSVHSSSAQLAPQGGALIHVARYLGIDDTAGRESLESYLDSAQPGWREVVVEARFLPKMTVSHAIVPPGGRRTDVDMLGMKNVFVAGDWVGPEGMLADAALASARRVAERLGAVAVKAAA